MSYSWSENVLANMYTHLNMAASDSADSVPGKDFNGLSSKEIAEV